MIQKSSLPANLRFVSKALTADKYVTSRVLIEGAIIRGLLTFAERDTDAGGLQVHGCIALFLRRGPEASAPRLR